MNKIVLSGNICKDIETKYYNDKKYIKNAIAVKRDYKNKNGEYDVDFFNFTIWSAQAEYIDAYAKKGDKIILSGKILNNNYEKDGQTIYSNDIQVETIELVAPKSQKSVEDDLPFDTDVVEIADKKSDKNMLD